MVIILKDELTDELFITLKNSCNDITKIQNNAHPENDTKNAYKANFETIHSTASIAEENSASSEEIAASTQEVIVSTESLANTAQLLADNSNNLIEQVNNFQLKEDM